MREAEEQLARNTPFGAEERKKTGLLPLGGLLAGAFRAQTARTVVPESFRAAAAFFSPRAGVHLAEAGSSWRGSLSTAVQEFLNLGNFSVTYTFNRIRA